MKLLRVGPFGAEKPALRDAQGILRDLSGHIDDIAGDALTAYGLARLRAINPTSLPILPASLRVGACVGGVGKVICVGLNYADHAAETGATPPAEPILFMKATSALCGPNDDVMIPKESEKTDWEVELGVVIGDVARNVSIDAALSHVAGYCIVNDLSERAFQLEGTGQWVKGKSADTFGPIGPWLVTRDEIPNPQDLAMELRLNGEIMQQGSTRTMIFGVAHLVSYASRFMSLHPGDIISTGTPPGVGMGKKPPRFLRPGDEMVLTIEGLSTQKQQVISWRAQ
jgi:2,4-didehydro-3-deoxy-L-rhamnonate hydrolase